MIQVLNVEELAIVIQKQNQTFFFSDYPVQGI